MIHNFQQPILQQVAYSVQICYEWRWLCDPELRHPRLQIWSSRWWAGRLGYVTPSPQRRRRLGKATTGDKHVQCGISGNLGMNCVSLLNSGGCGHYSDVKNMWAYLLFGLWLLCDPSSLPLPKIRVSQQYGDLCICTNQIISTMATYMSYGLAWTYHLFIYIVRALYCAITRAIGECIVRRGELVARKTKYRSLPNIKTSERQTNSAELNSNENLLFQALNAEVKSAAVNNAYFLTSTT